MADLVTHLCSALLPAAFLPRRWLGAVCVGTVLPDALTHVPTHVLAFLEEAGAPIPREALFPWTVMHMPAGILLSCGLIAMVFRADQRRVAFAALLGGGALHLFLDLFQSHHGLGYFLLYPLSLARFELGWIGSEATVPWAPWLTLATALVWAVRLLWERKQPDQASG